MPASVDAHCHFWTLARGDYDWLDPSNPALQPIARDFGLADLQAAGGCGDLVVVQAAPTVAETEFLLRLADVHPEIAAVVGWVDLAQPEAATELRRLAHNPKFRGVRPMLQDIADPDWIVTAPRPDAVATLIELGLRFDALVLPQHLAGLLAFAQRYPDLPIVIDHAAKPALTAPASDPRHAIWREGMQRLAQQTRACCKLSGLLTELDAAQLAVAEEVLAPLVADLLDWFGPERLIWGSDWPVVTLAGSYHGWREMSVRLLSGCSDRARHQIFAENAQRFYGLGGTP